jgi:hypothetical protein
VKIKTSDLTGKALDWAVAFSQGMRTETWYANSIAAALPGAPRATPFRPSRAWEDGGPIIEQERLDVLYMGDGITEHYWRAEAIGGFTFAESPTPLVAAMRCYVASKLGDEIDVPEELL